MKSKRDRISPRSIYWASFNRFSLRLPGEAALDCSHSGSCDADVAHWAPRIPRPADCTPERLRKELKEYGAWDAEELADDETNWGRIVWIAASNICEDDQPDTSRPVGRIALYVPHVLTEREQRIAGLHETQR